MGTSKNFYRLASMQKDGELLPTTRKLLNHICREIKTYLLDLLLEFINLNQRIGESYQTTKTSQAKPKLGELQMTTSKRSGESLQRAIVANLILTANASK